MRRSDRDNTYRFMCAMPVLLTLVRVPKYVNRYPDVIRVGRQFARTPGQFMFLHGKAFSTFALCSRFYLIIENSPKSRRFKGLAQPHHWHLC